MLDVFLVDAELNDRKQEQDTGESHAKLEPSRQTPTEVIAAFGGDQSCKMLAQVDCERNDGSRRC